MRLIQKTVLITVKAYPNPSKQHVETVCCAGIDLEGRKWVRLYPIPFRLLHHKQQFSKYSIISIRCYKAKDKRIESYKIDQDSIQVIDKLDTRNNWEKRKNIVLPTVSSSFCQIQKDVVDNKSLGVFKPCDISFIWKKAASKDINKRKASYAQLSFFDPQKNAIEQIPFDFYYQFKCYGHSHCPGHKLLVIDWELGQAYRSWKNAYKTEDLLLEKIKQRWLDGMCSEKHDTYFYVGNQHRFQNQFMILGTFYPKK